MGKTSSDPTKEEDEERCRTTGKGGPHMWVKQVRTPQRRKTRKTFGNDLEMAARGYRSETYTVFSPSSQTD
ncbi:hypothetical protein EYF80_064657 [Liparis tanakae]|uniref:Uncharacterized protein n=1 Tax=Liparis tanakae TaxID=230148 RepID=A0A4Z2E8X5_9TELE|nr:hypothetical protein EYF80_064657 [Liparis tanakae]